MAILQGFRKKFRSGQVEAHPAVLKTCTYHDLILASNPVREEVCPLGYLRVHRFELRSELTGE